MSNYDKEALARNRASAHEPKRIVAWTDPPAEAEMTAGVRKRKSYARLTEELRRNPGKWAQLADRASENAAYQFALIVARGGRGAFRPEGAYEAANAGKSLWIRYVGPPELSRPIEPIEVDEDADDDVADPIFSTGEPRPEVNPTSAFTF